MNPALLRLLHLTSPALPIGAFHFSQGLEYAVERGWVCDEASAGEWIGGLAEHSLGALDLPVLARLHQAWTSQDADAAHRWSRFLLASRETQELRAEERHLGAALERVLNTCGISSAAGRDAPFAAVFSYACVAWCIGEKQCLQGYAWTWLENQTLAAVKLIPLGQSAGQRILHTLTSLLARVCAHAACIDDQSIGGAAVGQWIASARHESQYTRLFKS